MLLQITYSANTEYKPFVVKFQVIDLPIYAEEKINKLDYLVENNTFRHKLVLYNTSNISYKIQAYIPNEINEYVELNPVLGYVQVSLVYVIPTFA